VTRARLHLDIRFVLQPDADAAVPSVLARVRAGESEDVVRRDVPGDFRECLTEIVRVGKRRPAGVGRKSRQCFLLGRQLTELLRDGLARERADTAAASLPSAA